MSESPEGPVEFARRMLREQEERDAAGVEDYSLPPPSDWRYAAEHLQRMTDLRRKVVEAEDAERARQQEAANAVVTRNYSAPVETPTEPAKNFYEQMADTVGRYMGGVARELRGKVDGYLVAANARADALESRVADAERRLAKLEGKKR